MSNEKKPKIETPKLPDKEPMQTIDVQASKKKTKKYTGNIKK